MNKAIATFALVAAAAFSAAADAASATLPAAADAGYDGTFRVRVAGYNIRYKTTEKDSTNDWDNRKVDLVNLVKDIDPDVIGFNEVDPPQMSDLKAMMPEYEIIGRHRTANNTQRATPVAYRKSRFAALGSGTFWLTTTPDVPGSQDLGDGYVSSCPETCSWVTLRDKNSGGVFCFFCTHLDHIDAELRRRNMQVLLSKIATLRDTGIPVVVVGDMNAKEAEPTILAATAVMQNSLLVSKTTPTGSWRTYTYWSWRPDEKSCEYALATYTPEERSSKVTGIIGHRIDHIFTSFGTEVESFATRNDARPGMEYYPSDHYPVVANLRMSCANNLYAGKVRIEIDKTVPYAGHGRYVLTHGANIVDDENLEFVLPEWVERAAVEDGEIVIYTKPEPLKIILR